VPVMSSEVEFFDILYLGIFAILSPAFDKHFYSKKPPATLVEEAAYARRHFHSLLHIFSLRFIILLEGDAVAHSYIVDRMLAEFAAAATLLAKGASECEDDGDAIAFPLIAGSIKDILQGSYPHIFPYYSRCLDSSHKHFTWIGPRVQIVPRSEDIASIIPLTTRGELLDLPGHSIYTADVDIAPPATMDPIGKRHDRGDEADPADQQSKKQRC
jgi:hypothetical protein